MRVIKHIGREETRAAARLPHRDFCKLHIVIHYIAAILKEIDLGLEIYPVGAVGNDGEGKELLELISEAGISRKYIKMLEGVPTLHSICFQYDDGSGGNITESNSASARVNETFFTEIVGDLTAARAGAAAGTGTVVFAVPGGSA